MSNMFTNPRDEQYMQHATRNMGDEMNEQQVKDAAKAWDRAFKAIAPIQSAGFSYTINPNGELTIGKGQDSITMDFEAFQTIAQNAMNLFAQYSDQEQTLSLRAKP